MDATAVLSLVANLETRRAGGSPVAVSDQRAVAPWHELGCDDAAAQALADRATRASQQAPRCCRSRDRAAASFSPQISSRLEDQQELARRGPGSSSPRLQK